MQRGRSSWSFDAALLLARGWLRTQPARRSATIVALAFAIFAVLVISVSAFLPTSTQLADKQFGTFEASTYSSVNLGDLRTGDTARIRSRLRVADSSAHLVIESDALRPDSLTKRFVQAPLSVLRYVEDPTLRRAFPDRYTVKQGAWPTGPRDVAVSPALLKALPDRSRFTVMSGRVTLRVVGVVQDAYAKKDDTIVAGPGTWESIPPAPPGRASAPTEAQLRVLVGDGATTSAATRALDQVLPALPKGMGKRVNYLSENRLTRSDVLRDPVPRFGSDQFVVSYLPLLLLVLLVVSLVVSQTRPAHRDSANRLLAMGVPRVRAMTAHVVTIAVTIGLAITTGLVVGWVIAIGLRAAVLPRFANQVLSPTPALDRTVVAISALCLAFVLVGTMWPAPAGDHGRWAMVRRSVAELQLGLVRRAAVILLALSAPRIGGGVNSVLASYVAVAAVLLVVPDIFRAVVWALPQRSPRTWVARRLMESDVRRQATAAVAVASCIALPVLVATQLVSKKASDASYTFSRIPAHQIWVQSDTGIGDVKGAARAISGVTGISRSVALRSLRSNDDKLAAFFTKEQRSGRSSSNIMVVETAEQARRIIGHDLPADAPAVLSAGGVLNFTRTGGDQRLEVISRTGRRILTTPPLRTFKVPLPITLRANFGGAILRETAQQLNLPVSTPTRYVFPNVSRTAIAEAAQTAVDAGYDSDFVQFAVVPPPPQLPTTAYVFLSALILGGFAVLTTVMRGQAQRLRDYLARLIALGLGTGWTLSVLGIQAVLIVSVGLVAGVAAGVLGIQTTAQNYTVTVIPAVPIAIACLATFLASCLAIGSAVRKLTAVDSPEMT